VVFVLETKKIIKIRSRTPATASESERSDRGPSRDHQESNEVRVTLLFDERDNIPQTRRQTSPSSPSDDDSAYGKSTVSPTTARAREALAIDLEVQDFLVDELLTTRAIPTRIYARKPCARAREYAAHTRSPTIGQPLPAAVVARESRRPRSRGRPQDRGGRTFVAPCRPELVARGPRRVDCRGRVPEHSASPRHHSRGRENQGEVRPQSRSTTPSRPVLRFPCIRPIATRGNEDGSGALLQPPPEQEDEKISLFKRISPFDASMELKFELDTRLTVSCVVAVASAYGLLTVSIALDSILLAFGNAVILLLILFVLFGWRELLGEFKKRTAN
jgi:hypothetical protein